MPTAWGLSFSKFENFFAANCPRYYRRYSNQIGVAEVSIRNQRNSDLINKAKNILKIYLVSQEGKKFANCRRLVSFGRRLSHKLAVDTKKV